MRNIQYRYLLTVLLITAGPVLFGQVEKTKTVTESYKVGADTRLEIDSRYGKIHIDTWDQNVIDVEVTVTAKRRSERRAEELLDKVDIDISGGENSSYIRFKTSIDGSINNRSDENFKIDYKVSMPKVNPLMVSHRYGSFYLDDLDADVDLRIKYGNMRVEKVTGDFEVELSYGNGEIDELGSGNMEINYSRMDVEKAQDLDLESKYSNVSIGTARDVDVNNRYGKLELDKVDIIEGESRYGGIQIESLVKGLVMEVQYGSGISVDHVDSGFDRIDIESSHASSDLTFEPGVNATVEGKFRYCDLKYDDGDVDFKYINTGNTSREYRGNIGSGGNSKIKLYSSYGNIRIRIR